MSTTLKEYKTKNGIKIKPLTEVANPEGPVKLPRQVEVTLPPEKLSRNGRVWEDVSNGVKATQDLISQGVQVAMYLGHPCWDDPIVSGKIPAGYIVGITENEDTSVTFVADLGSVDKQGQWVMTRQAKWVAAAIAAEIDVDCSIRAVAEYDWDCWTSNGLDRCSIPEGSFPLLCDFLPPDDTPGIPGTKVTNVTQWSEAIKKIFNTTDLVNAFVEAVQKSGLIKPESTQVEGDKKDCEDSEDAEKCKSKMDDSTEEPDNKDDKKESIQLKNKTTVISSENLTSKTNRTKAGASGRKGVTMAIKPNVEMFDAGALVDLINNTPDDQLRPMVIGVLTGLGMAMGDLGTVANAEEPAEPAEDEMPEEGETGTENAKKYEAYQKAVRLYEARIAVTRCVREYQKEQAKKAKPATETTTHQQPAYSESILKIARVVEKTGATEEDIETVLSDAAGRRQSAKLESELRGKINKAIEAKQVFLGHELYDTDRYPVTALETAIQKAIKKGSIELAESFLEGNLGSLPIAATQEKLERENKELGGTMRATRYEVGEDNNLFQAVDRIVDQVQDYAIEQNSSQFGKFAKDRTSKTAEAQRIRTMCKKEYGGALRGKGRITKEDANSMGLSNMPNYAAVQASLMLLNYWAPSPIMQLVATSIPEGMYKLGTVVNSPGMPRGQYIEVYTEQRSQRRTHDGAFIQRPEDPQTEISLNTKPHQYFGFWETTRMRWDDEMEFWLSLDPLLRDVPARAIFNLQQEMMKYKEQRVSFAMLRSNDDYAATTITNETTNISVTSHWKFFAGGAGSEGIDDYENIVIENAIGWVKLRRGQGSSTDPLVLGPVVRTAVDSFIQRVTTTLPVQDPVSINAINGVTQSRGKLEYNELTGNWIGTKINASDPDPTFIVLWDIGMIVFLSGSGFDATHMPTISQYSKVNNYVAHDCTAASTTQLGANSFVELIGAMRANIRSRQFGGKIDFLLLPNLINEAYATFATHFQGLNQLTFAAIANAYVQGNVGESNAAATFRDTTFWGTTEPMYEFNKRGLLGASGLTVAMDYRPPTIGRESEGAIVDQNGVVQYTGQKSIPITEYCFIASIPRRNVTTDAPIEYPQGSIFFSAAPEGAGLPR